MACHTFVCLSFSPHPNPPPASLPLSPHLSLPPSFPPCFIIFSFYCPVLVTGETEGHSCVSLSSFIFLSRLIVQAAWSINPDFRFHNPVQMRQNSISPNLEHISWLHSFPTRRTENPENMVYLKASTVDATYTGFSGKVCPMCRQGHSRFAQKRNSHLTRDTRNTWQGGLLPPLVRFCEN